MTSYRRCDIRCSVCGKEQRITYCAGTSYFGYPDLDGRPGGMGRDTLPSSVHRCSHCGYVASYLEGGRGIRKAFLQSEAYRTCEGLALHSDLAVRFYQSHMIHRARKEYHAAFYDLLHAAWASDDRAFSYSIPIDVELEMLRESQKAGPDGWFSFPLTLEDIKEKYPALYEEKMQERKEAGKDAALLRRLALDMAEKVMDWEPEEEMPLHRLDLLRRSGQFEKVIADETPMPEEFPAWALIAAFQKQKAAERDDRPYRTCDVPGLKDV